MSAGFLSRIVEDGELGSHKESLPVETHSVVLSDPVPLLAVEAVPELRNVPCVARAEVCVDSEPDLVILERNLSNHVLLYIHDRLVLRMETC